MRPEKIEFTEEIPVRAFIWSIEQYPYHWHKAVEIIYVLKGRAKIVMAGEVHSLVENNIAVINGDEPHCIQKTDGDNRLLIIQINPVFCTSVNPDFRDAIFYCCSAYHEAEAPEKYAVLKGYVARLVCLLNGDPGQNQPIKVKKCLEEMLAHLIGNFNYLSFGTGTKSFKYKQVIRYKRIYEHVRSTPAQKQSLRELAKISGISPQHLSHDIRIKFGWTFKQLLHYQRCEQAARLLLSTDEFIYHISAQCGFPDPKYLIKSFKLFFNCTPSEFRKMYGGDADKLASQVRYQEVPLSSAFETNR